MKLQVVSMNPQNSSNTPTAFRRSTFPRILWAQLLAVTICLLPAVLDGQIRRQGFRQSSLPTLVLPAPPRQLRRNLERAQRFVDAGQYTEAVDLLDAILSAPDSEDFFIKQKLDQAVSEDEAENDEQLDDDLRLEPAQRQPFMPASPLRNETPRELGTNRTTLKTEACRILGSLPRQGREFYELQVGKTAKRALQSAVESHDINAVDEISRRYFHTAAGYEATLLLARHALDNNLPTTASIHLTRLREAPQAAKKYEPQLTVLLAVCRKLMQQEDKAQRLLAEARSNFGQSRIQIEGEVTRLPDTIQEADRFLEELLGTFDPARQTKLASWQLFRGTQDRNAESSGGMPLTKREWAVDTAVFASDEKKIAGFYEDLRKEKVPVLPVAQPLAVGDYLVVQAARMVLGVDMKTGRRVWPYPWNAEPVPEEFVTLRALRANPLIDDSMRSRIWSDFVHSQMSSDGELLFILRGIKTPPTTFRGMGNQPIRPKNRLVALELATEGKTVWLLGSDEGDDPALSEAFFLGAPLPVEGQLFVVAELKDELKLLTLDAKSGKMLWSQQLGHIESSHLNRQMPDNTRILNGSCPAFADGILVCPTASGALVAVDTQRRWLLWSYSYPQVPGHGGTFIQNGRLGRQLGSRWSDGAPVIADGKVLVTPVESEELHCLDLLTGELLWQLNRDERLFVAGAWNGIVVLVGPDHIQGIELSTGKRLWSSEGFPAEGMTSGRGFYSDGDYFLPTNAPQLLRIDIASGEIVEELDTDFELGNLVCHGNYIISQNHNSVLAFLQRDRIRDDVAQQLSDNPDDPHALENHASLLMGDGKTEEAIEVLRRAATLADRPKQLQSIRTRLCGLLLGRLEENFAKHESTIEEVRQLSTSMADSATLRQTHQVLASGLAATGRTREAFDELLDAARAAVQADTQPTEQRLMDVGDGRSVDVTVWLSETLNELLAAMDEADAKDAYAKIQLQTQELGADNLDGLQKWNRCISRLPASAAARLKLAAAYTDAGQALPAELILAELHEQLNSEDPILGEAAIEATNQLARLLASRDESELALQVRKQIDSIETPPASDPNSTVDQSKPSPAANQSYDFLTWPRGKVVANDRIANQSNRISNARTPTVSVIHHDSLWPEENRVEVDQTHVTVFDGYNQIRRRVQFQERARVGTNMLAAEAVARGHLLIYSNSSEIVAIDLLGDYEDSSQRIRWKQPIGGGQDLATISRIQSMATNTLVPRHHRLGPASGSAVTFVNRGDLVCCDMITGETMWQVNDVGKNPSLFGNEEVVFVAASPDASRVTAYDIQTGIRLNEVELPFDDKLCAPADSSCWAGLPKTRNCASSCLTPCLRRSPGKARTIPNHISNSLALLSCVSANRRASCSSSTCETARRLSIPCLNLQQAQTTLGPTRQPIKFKAWHC